MKKKISIIISFVCFFIVCFSANANAAATNEKNSYNIETSSIGHLCIYLDTQTNDFGMLIKKYSLNNIENGDGVFVFVENIDNSKIYKLPLPADNEYSIYQEMPYGNYKIIDKPNADKDEIFVRADSGFTINDDNPMPSIRCYLTSDIEMSPESAGNIQNSTDIPDADKNITSDEIKDAVNKIANQVEQKELAKAEDDDNNHFTIQNILSYIVVIVLFGLFIYNKFIRNKK